MPRVIITERGKPPQPYRFKLLLHDSISIGRGANNYMKLECRSTSVNHCEIERVDGGYSLLDKASTNGIEKNGELMEVIDLRDGMKVLIGDVTLEFQLSDEEIEELKGETFTPHEKKAQLPIDES